ncbi:MAG: type VI secretion system tube protein Hcp [Terriglobia bacterium]|jgi:type VI secretion system secreted protein Hcp
MAIEYFLKLEDVKGESLSSKHKEEIEVLSWSWGASNPTSVFGSGLSAGKVSFSDINITKPVDKSSAKLLELCCTGKHIKSGVLTCAKSTGDKTPADYLIIKLEEIHIAGFQCGGARGDEVGSESLAMAFVKIEYEYKIQGKDGSLTAAGKATYDIATREAT